MTKEGQVLNQGSMIMMKQDYFKKALQARDDNWMGCMYGMVELQLRIGGHPVTEEMMVTWVERYPLRDSTMYMCRMGPAFQEPIDDDDTTADEEDG
uniref:Uncharacterized protein n=1 Tax=Solanum tuberosum TaxID=4113 RepID=M1DZV0_SOLTU